MLSETNRWTIYLALERFGVPMPDPNDHQTTDVFSFVFTREVWSEFANKPRTFARLLPNYKDAEIRIGADSVTLAFERSAYERFYKFYTWLITRSATYR